MFSADKIVNHFSKVYNDKVVPRIKQKAIEKYKEENNPVLPQIQEEKVNIQEPKIPEHQKRLAKLYPDGSESDGFASEHQPGFFYRFAPQMQLTFS